MCLMVFFLVFTELSGVCVWRGISERLREVSRVYLLYLPGIYCPSSGQKCA